MIKESKEARISDMENSIVFKGDGEPRTIESTYRQLANIDRSSVLSDTYSLGGSVEQLEQKFSETLGKESAIFMPTGTLANHIAVRRLCGNKPKVIVQEQSHLYQDTGDCVARLSSIMLIPLAPGRPYFTVDELTAYLDCSQDARVKSPIGAVILESPVRRQLGQIVPFDQMQAISNLCKNRGLPIHLDGARLYMMAAATGVSVKEYASLFDSVYVSLYKYFGAPFGAILVGTSEFTSDLYHERRMFGGSLYSSYLAAVLTLQGMEGFEERFGTAMKVASDLFTRINTLQDVEIKDFEHGSNIFTLGLASGINTDIFMRSLGSQSIFVEKQDGSGLINLTVNTTILRRPLKDIFDAFKEAVKAGKCSSL